ncbi:MAG TPA: MerR family transcriptional regulator [Herpetosiphonaceae bacterium]
MAAIFRTSDLARELGVHVNTIRLYEAQELLAPVPRGANGYRQYGQVHLEQARLAWMAVSWPFLADKPSQVELVKHAARGDLGMAMELAYAHLAYVRTERTLAEAAAEFLERWAAGHLVDRPRQGMRIGDAARHLHVSVDMLRNWERNGLIEVPRDPASGYRLYGTAEFGRLRVIRSLVKAGYSLMAILRMLLQFDAGERTNLRAALDTLRPDEEPNVYALTDRWLSALLEQEERAQAIIRQVGRLIELACQQD